MFKTKFPLTQTSHIQTNALQKKSYFSWIFFNWRLKVTHCTQRFIIFVDAIKSENI